MQTIVSAFDNASVWRRTQSESAGFVRDFNGHPSAAATWFAQTRLNHSAAKLNRLALVQHKDQMLNEKYLNHMESLKPRGLGSAIFKQVDEKQVDHINSLSLQLIKIFPDKAFEHANNALGLAEKLNYQKGRGDAHFNLGLYYVESSNKAKAMDEFACTLQIRKELNEEEGIAAAYSKMGNICLSVGNYEDALNYYSEAVPLRIKTEDHKGAADLYTNMGAVHYYRGHYTMSLRSHLLAQRIYEKLNEEDRIATSYTNIGVIYFLQKNFTEALSVFEKALVIKTVKNDLTHMGSLYNNIGNVYYETEKYDEAFEFQKKALQITEQLKDKPGISNSYNNIGNIYRAQHNTQLAEEYYNFSLQLRMAIDDKRGMTESYANLGELYLSVEDYENAEKYLLYALELAVETDTKNTSRDSLMHLARLSAIRKDYEKAYNYHIQYTHLDKELTNADISWQLSQMSAEHKMEQKEKETHLERKKNEELTKAFDSLDEEKRKSEMLLHNILPEEIADELRQNGKCEPRHYDSVTVLFADIKDFTRMSEMLTPKQLINSLDTCFRNFDTIIEKHGIEKIKVIGDAYMCAGGLPVEKPDNAPDVVKAALEMQKFMFQFAAEQSRIGLPPFQFRIGINTGPVIAGIVGHRKFAYDIWGDTVNVASRMESSSEAGKVNISGTTYQAVKEYFKCVHRGKIEAKHKGEIDMYFVEGCID